MKAKDRQRNADDLRSIAQNLNLNRLRENPDQELRKQGLIDAAVIIENFDSGEGTRFTGLLNEFLTWARPKKRPEHVEVLVNTISNTILELAKKIETYPFHSRFSEFFRNHWKRIVGTVFVIFAGLYLWAGYPYASLGALALVLPLAVVERIKEVFIGIGEHFGARFRQ